MTEIRTYESWGRYPRLKAQKIIHLKSRENIPPLNKFSCSVLPYGLGRSYGDCCLNENGILLDTASLSKIISLDEKHGILSCESGVSLADILFYIVPRGWFLPVTPGTKFVTIGGAIANDVHGKNHHQAGTFGCHVLRFELLRSDGQRFICSQDQNKTLFQATIGGLGLTGLILWADIQLRPVKCSFIEIERIRFRNIEEFIDLSSVSDKDYEYTVSWVDCTARGKYLGRGIFIRGNHADPEKYELPKEPKLKQLVFPFDAPSIFLNKFVIRCFNSAYYNKQRKKYKQSIENYSPFFYPLDAILKWNKMYGKSGFFQYQCVIPFSNGIGSVKRILSRIAHSGNASFLAVIKIFSNIPSPGIMSFPRAGITLSLDFPNHGEKTLHFLNNLDKVVYDAGGALYPSKDARMSPNMFKSSFPNWQQFTNYIDPKFSSSFWRRVTRS